MQERKILGTEAENKSLFNLYNDIGLALFGADPFSWEIYNVLVKNGLNRVGTRLLEAGCGCGKLGLCLSQFGMNYVGMDIDKTQLDRAEIIKRHAEAISDKKFDAVFLEGNIHEMTFSDNSFDMVFNEGVIEHWLGDTQQNAVNEMARVSGNIVLIFVPSADSPAAMEAAEKVVHTYKGMGPKEFPISKTNLCQLMVNAGLVSVSVRDITERMIVGVGHKSERTI